MRLSEGLMSALQCRSSSGSLPEYCVPQVVARQATQTFAVGSAESSAGAVTRRSRATAAYITQQTAVKTVRRACVRAKRESRGVDAWQKRRAHQA